MYPMSLGLCWGRPGHVAVNTAQYAFPKIAFSFAGFPQQIHFLSPLGWCTGAQKGETHNRNVMSSGNVWGMDLRENGS